MHKVGASWRVRPRISLPLRPTSQLDQPDYLRPDQTRSARRDETQATLSQPLPRSPRTTRALRQRPSSQQDADAVLCICICINATALHRIRLACCLVRWVERERHTSPPLEVGQMTYSVWRSGPRGEEACTATITTFHSRALRPS